MEIDQRRFRRRQQEFLLRARRVRNPVHFIAEFRELARGVAALIIQHVRHKHQFVAVAQMLFHKEIEQRPFEPRAHSAVNPRTGPRKLCAALVINHMQALAELHMVFRHKAFKLRLLAEIVKRLVVFFSARGNVFVGHIRQTQQKRFLLLFNFIELGAVFLHFRRKRLHARHQFGNVAALFFNLRNFFAGGVLLGALCFRFRGNFAAFCVNRENIVNNFVGVVISLFCARFDFVRIAADQFNVDHELFSLLNSI